MNRYACILISIIALGSSAQALEDDGKTLVFGIIATESAANLSAAWTPFIQAMEKGLGMKVKPFYAPDYGGVIEGMRFGKVDIAWHGNKSGMEAVDRANGEIFVQMVDADGSPGYWSLMLVHRDSPHKTLDDVLKNAANLNFGNGDPNSTSGFLVPSYYIFAMHNIDPATAFKRVTNANHEANLLAVANKQVDVATNNTMDLRRMQQKDPAMASQVRAVWTSPLIPADPMVWHKDLPDDLKMKIKTWFLAFGRQGPNAEAERAILAKTIHGLAPFRDSSNHQLLPIRQLELFKKKIAMQKSDKHSDAEKTQAIAEIDQQLADLAKLSALIAKGW